MNEADGCSPGGKRCSLMADIVEDVRIPVSYSPRFRDYGILYIDGSKQIMHFCPWCGGKLPEPLGEEWFERVRAMGLEPNDPRIPEEMYSDRWWKEANL